MYASDVAASFFTWAMSSTTTHNKHNKKEKQKYSSAVSEVVVQDIFLFYQVHDLVHAYEENRKHTAGHASICMTEQVTWCIVSVSILQRVAYTECQIIHSQTATTYIMHALMRRNLKCYCCCRRGRQLYARCQILIDNAVTYSRWQQLIYYLLWVWRAAYCHGNGDHSLLKIIVYLVWFGVAFLAEHK